jgi:hypothetical protein
MRRRSARLSSAMLRENFALTLAGTAIVDLLLRELER